MATGTSSSTNNGSPSITILPLVVLLMTTIFFSPIPRVAGEPPSVVPPACKAATAVAGGTITEDFCLSTLAGKTTAGAADYADLAIIAVDLVTANATATEAKIDALLGSSSSSSNTSEGLQQCRALYGAVVRQYQPECRAAVRAGRYGDGKTCLGRTVQAAASCERWFLVRHLASPVAAEDAVVAEVANLAIALASIA